MSYTVDTNVLLYASDERSRLHGRAVEIIATMAAGPEIAYLFWPTVLGYLRVATHPGVFGRPLSIAEALGNVEQLLARPHVRTTGETERFWPILRDVVADAMPAGNLVPDAHLVALMVENGVGTILTRDRDFRRFTPVEARDPFG